MRVAGKIGNDYQGVTRTNHGGLPVPFKSWAPAWFTGNKKNSTKEDVPNSSDNPSSGNRGSNVDMKVNVNDGNGGTKAVDYKTGK